MERLILKIIAGLLLLVLIFGGMSLKALQDEPNIVARDVQLLNRGFEHHQQTQPFLQPVVVVGVSNSIERIEVSTEAAAIAAPIARRNGHERSGKLQLSEAEEIQEPIVADLDLNGTLIIPKIELNNQVVPLPFIDGHWRTENLDLEVGLLEGTGRFPQDDQAMVFAGHYTIYWPLAGPFIDLDKLMPKDEIVYVYDNQKYVYKISKLAYVDPEQVELIFRDNGDQIVLLTCSQFDLLDGSFGKRLLVIADLVEIRPSFHN